MLFTKNTLFTSILIVSIISLVAVENSQCMKIATAHAMLPKINISRSTKPCKKIRSLQFDYFATLDKTLKQDLELMSFIDIPEDKSYQGPLQYSLNLFDHNYLLNIEKINAVYELIDEILRVKHSMPVKKIYTSYSGIIQTQITTLIDLPDSTLISLMFIIENNLISYKDIHENLLFAAKDFLMQQVKNWESKQFHGKDLAIRLLFFSGQGYKNAVKNVERVTPWNKEIASKFFAASETVNFAIILLELFDDIRVRSIIRSMWPKIALLQEIPRIKL
ncbi:MAG: hypothetical protein V1646_05320 [bacterium]